MAYLTAEQLSSRESLSEQEIMKAMSDAEYRQQLASNGRPLVPMSALSMEEQRILQSLDRLNDKLKGKSDSWLCCGYFRVLYDNSSSNITRVLNYIIQ